MSELSDILNGDKPVLVDFYATWCGPCKMMSPILDQLKEKMGDKIAVIKIDVDKNPGFAAKYSVQSVPTILIFHKGIEQWKQSGVIQASELERHLEKFL